MKPRIPRRLLLELAVSLARGRQRDLMADSSRLLAGLAAPPSMPQAGCMPSGGGLVLVSNHYQRRDLWIGWAGSLLIQAAGRPVHWLTLRELRLHGRELPLSQGIFSRVARTYGFISVPAATADHAGHVPAIRQAIRLLRQGEVVGFFPEGEHGHSGGLSPALPGAGELAWLLSRFAPIVPAAVWEEDRRLCAAIGEPMQLAKPDGEALMAGIAALLPSRHRRSS